MNRRQTLRLTSTVVGSPVLFGLTACAPNEPTPNASFKRLDGQPSQISDFRGQVVLVNFWATSCTTCVHEMPQLVATHKKFEHQGYQTLAVAMGYDPLEYVRNFVQTRQLPFIVTHDASGELAQTFGGIRLTPTSLLLNKQGRVIKRYTGEPDFNALHALIEKLLIA